MSQSAKLYYPQFASSGATRLPCGLGAIAGNCQTPCNLPILHQTMYLPLEYPLSIRALPIRLLLKDNYLHAMKLYNIHMNKII